MPLSWAKKSPGKGGKTKSQKQKKQKGGKGTRTRRTRTAPATATDGDGDDNDKHHPHPPHNSGQRKIGGVVGQYELKRPRDIFKKSSHPVCEK